MRPLIRFFFRTLRWMLGPLLLLGEWLTRPPRLVRTPAAQASIDAECANLLLYQFATCPFCIKVRQELRRRGLTIERRDAQHSPVDRAALAAGGGRIKVPCLKISTPEGTQWLYESTHIIAWLQQHFPLPERVG